MVSWANELLSFHSTRGYSRWQCNLVKRQWVSLLVKYWLFYTGLILNYSKFLYQDYKYHSYNVKYQWNASLYKSWNIMSVLRFVFISPKSVASDFQHGANKTLICFYHMVIELWWGLGFPCSVEIQISWRENIEMNKQLNNLISTQGIDLQPMNPYYCIHNSS